MLVRSSTTALTAESAVHFASLDQGLATWVHLGLQVNGTAHYRTLALTAATEAQS